MSEDHSKNTPHIVASTFSVLMSGTEYVLMVNMVKPTFKEGEFVGGVEFEPQVVLHMSPQAAKELYIVTKGAVDGYEASFGELKSPLIEERTKD